MSHLTQNTVPVSYPQQMQQHSHHPHLKAAPGFIAGNATANVVANALPGGGVGRTAGNIAAGLVSGHVVGKNVNKFAHHHH